MYVKSLLGQGHHWQSKKMQSTMRHDFYCPPNDVSIPLQVYMYLLCPSHLLLNKNTGRVNTKARSSYCKTSLTVRFTCLIKFRKMKQIKNNCNVIRITRLNMNITAQVNIINMSITT